MKSGNTICILAQEPRRGRFKSRLKGFLSPKQSAHLARAFLLDKMASSLQIPNADVCVAYWPQDAEKEFADILCLFQNEETDPRIVQKALDVGLLPQYGETQGQQLCGVSKALFDRGAKRVLLLPSESPLVEPVILKAAMDLLASNEVVIGPTFDGHYYLLGVNKHYPSLFENIHWKGENVYKETLEQLNAANLSWQELELSYEINGPDELEQLCCDIDNLRLAGKNNICYHTEKCLANLRL